jgi:solute carrier family 25 2-oxodicarboxylate transporter 21
LSSYTSDAHATWPVLQVMWEGFIAGLIATSFNAPFDTAKSRIQARPPLLGGRMEVGARTGGSEGQSTFAVLREIIRHEGVLACYKGFRPKALRMALGAAVALATYETTLKILNPEP